MGVFDVPPAFLLEAIAKDFKEKKTVHAPAFAHFVKTGAHAERAPQDEDWYYTRCASILYRVLKDGPVGTESLRTYYGGRKARGSRPHEHRKAGGKIIRLALQQLEKAVLIKKASTGGRAVTPAGQKYLNEMSKVAADLAKNYIKKKRTFVRGSKAAADVRTALRRGKIEKTGKEEKRDDVKKKKKEGSDAE